MQWISVKDRMPIATELVLVLLKYKQITHAICWWNPVRKKFIRQRWTSMRPETENLIKDVFTIEKKLITHWMLLPEPPLAKRGS